MAFSSNTVKAAASEAAMHFVQEQMPLNETIAKMASDEAWNPEQIQRVSEEANKNVFLLLFAKEQDKTFEWDLADATKISSMLQEKAEPTKVGSQIAADVYLNEFPALPESLRDPEPDQTDDKVRINDTLLSRLEITRDLLKQAEYEVGEEILDISVRICEFIKEAVLQNDWTTDEVYYALTSMRPKYAGRVARLCGVVAENIGQDFRAPDPVKTAAPVDDDMISSRLHTGGGFPVQIVNGGHKVFMDLDTLVRLDSDRNTLADGIYGVVDKVTYLKKNIRNYVSQVVNK